MIVGVEKQRATFPQSELRLLLLLPGLEFI